MARRIFLISVFFGGLLWWSPSVFASEITPWHTTAAEAVVDFYNFSADERVTDQQRSWLLWGVAHEGIPTRAMHHSDTENAAAWVHDADAQQPVLYEGVYTWEQAIYDAARGDEQRAWEGLGHVLHVLLDVRLRHDDDPVRRFDVTTVRAGGSDPSVVIDAGDAIRTLDDMLRVRFASDAIVGYEDIFRDGAWETFALVEDEHGVRFRRFVIAPSIVGGVMTSTSHPLVRADREGRLMGDVVRVGRGLVAHFVERIHLSRTAALQHPEALRALRPDIPTPTQRIVKSARGYVRTKTQTLGRVVDTAHAALRVAASSVALSFVSSFEHAAAPFAFLSSRADVPEEAIAFVSIDERAPIESLAPNAVTPRLFPLRSTISRRFLFPETIYMRLATSVHSFDGESVPVVTSTPVIETPIDDVVPQSLEVTTGETTEGTIESIAPPPPVKEATPDPKVVLRDYLGFPRGYIHRSTAPPPEPPAEDRSEDNGTSSEGTESDNGDATDDTVDDATSADANDDTVEESNGATNGDGAGDGTESESEEDGTSEQDDDAVAEDGVDAGGGSSTDENDTDGAGENAETGGDGDGAESTEGDATDDTTSTVCVDVNTATVEELMTIKHIGPARAAAIIALRPFASVDDLIRVPGIGHARLAEIKAEGIACVL